jgi:hypothetical protein
MATTLSLLASCCIVTLESSVKPPTAGATTILGDYGGGREMAVDPFGGYWIASWTGAVTPFGGAPSYGSPTVYGIHLNQPVVGMAGTPSGHGYWLVATDGGIFNFGDAHFYGSTGGMHLNKPIVGMATAPSGHGYWLVASDGGIFTYGDAGFYGSTGSIPLNQPIVGMAATPDGKGYWLVASDGGIFSFGDAAFHGSTGSIHLNKPIVGMATTPDGGGYWLVALDGGVFNFGDANFGGSIGGSAKTVIGLTVNPSTSQYTIVASDGSTSSFSPQANALTSGGFGGQTAGIGGGPQGSDCQPRTEPTAQVDWSLTNLFADQSGPGWIGGDGTYSTELPNGSESFVFSDTLVGTAQPSGMTSVTGMPNNSELVGPMPNLTSDFNGTFGAPQSLIPDPPGTDHWWTAATDVENGLQLIYLNEFAPVSGSAFDYFTGRSAIAAMALTSSGLPTLQTLTYLPTDPDTQWGNAVVQSGPYVYVYGIVSDPSSGAFYGMKIARVPAGQSTNNGTWTYWTGTAWVQGEGNASLVNTGVILTGVAVQQGGQGYVAASIPGGLHGTSVDLSYACSPTGPWSVPQPVYSIPQIGEYANEFAYIPTFHPELSQNGLVVSYNINSTNQTAVLQNVHQYQPQFILLNNQ